MRWRMSPERADEGCVRERTYFAWWPVSDPVTRVTFWLERVWVRQQRAWSPAAGAFWLVLRAVPVKQ